MFDIGFSELLVIAVVALIVLGPERLPKAARFAGLWVRKARAQWYSVRSEFEREMAADELRRSLVAPAEQLRDSLTEAGRDVRGAVAAIDADARAAGGEAAATPDAAAPDGIPTDAAAPDAVAPDEAGAADADPAQPSLFDEPPPR
jgi:sec-independent protein translocase protein TatB